MLDSVASPLTSLVFTFVPAPFKMLFVGACASWFTYGQACLWRLRPVKQRLTYGKRTFLLL